jgi:hypothetical protein
VISKRKAKAKAASIKATIDNLHAAVEELPPSDGKVEVVTELDRLHRKLNGLARLAADFFDDEIETFSGGTDKPEEE